MADRTSSSGSWLFGPIPDLLLGSGLLYMSIFAIFSIVGSPLRDAIPVWVLVLGAVVVSGPHYGGTLLRVYEHRVDRRSYALFSLWATLGIIGLFVISVYNVSFGAWFFTVYITWSPWHYTGQNFGLTMMFLRRRGVEVSPLARRLLYTSFTLSFFTTFLVYHGSKDAAGWGYTPTVATHDAAGVMVQSLGIPVAITSIAMPLVAIGSVATLVAAIVMMARTATWQKMGPALVLMGSQFLWFTLPYSFAFWKIHTGIDPIDSAMLFQYVFWVAMAHSVQYLWVTSYYAKASSNWTGTPIYIAKAMVTGVAVWTIPSLIFATPRLGTMDSAEGLVLLVAALANIHHFTLDGAIWKLRNSRVASVLLRPASETQVERDTPGWPWMRHIVWAVCGISLVISLSVVYLEQVVLIESFAARDAVRARAVLDRLSELGTEKARYRATVGGAFARRGDADDAIEQYERSVELRSTAQAWIALATIYSDQENWPAVVDVYLRSRDQGPIIGKVGGFAVLAYYELGDPERARAILVEALTMYEPQAQNYEAYAALTLEGGDVEESERYLEEARRLRATEVE